MDAVNRLRATSSATSPRTPSSPAADTDSDNQAESSSSSSKPGLKWFQKKPERGRRHLHPYELKALSIGEEPPLREYSRVEFWPFTGPLAKLGKGRWDEMEGCIAITAMDPGQLLVGRCTDDEPYEELWAMNFRQDSLFHVAWSFHPFTLHPLLAVAGKSGLIYIIDFVTRTCIRKLRGHGGEILCVYFSPTDPHILASGSEDRTIRIWNILGGDVECKDGEILSENFPQADADEGTCLVAVLAGEGYGGHRAQVCDLAFHPKHRTLASAGADHTVKIWPLPPYPEANPDEPPTPKGYRAQLVYHPLFSTDRIHTSALDSIEWIGEDILLSRSNKETVAWQWYGFRRFFHPDKYEASSTYVQHSDFHQSHSFQICGSLPIQCPFWWWRIGLHTAFQPDEDDDPQAVTDTLFAWPVTSNPPSIRFLNPTMMPLRFPSSPPDRLRSLTPQDDDDSAEDQDKPGSRRVPIVVGDSGDEEDGDDAVESLDGETGNGAFRHEPGMEMDIDGSVPVLGGVMETTDGHHSNARQPNESRKVTEGHEPPSRVSNDRAAKRMRVSALYGGQRDDHNQHGQNGGEDDTDAEDGHDNDYDPYQQEQDGDFASPVMAFPTPNTSTAASISASTPIAAGGPGSESKKGKKRTKAQSQADIDAWSLSAHQWKSVIKASKLSSKLKNALKSESTIPRHVTISPRGAKWIVMVGYGQTVAVWGMKERKGE